MKLPVLAVPLSGFFLFLSFSSANAQLRPEPGDLLWSQEIGGQIWAPLTYHDGVLYFGADDSTFHAFDIEAREVKWRFHTGGIIRSGAEVVDEHVVFASDDGYLYSLDLDSGKEFWRFDLGSAGFERGLPAIDPPYSYDYRHSSPLNRGGVIYVGSASGILYAIYDDTGLEFWRFATDGPIRSTPVAEGRNIVFGSRDGHVYSVDALRGTLSWRFDTSGLVQGAAEVGAGKVFAGSRSARVFALDADTGDEQWQHVNEDGSWVESSPVFDDGVLYIGSSDALALYALDAESGATIWEFKTGGWSWSDPVLEDDVVYIGGLSVSSYYFEGVDLRPGFFAVDQETGAGLWEFTPQLIEGFVNGGVFSTPAIVGGVIYVAGIDGRLYALKQ